MLRLVDFQTDRRTITVTVVLNDESHEINITYRPSVFTVEFNRQLAQMPIEDFITEVVDGWDVEDIDPADPADVRRLPTAFLAQISAATQADVWAGKATSATSRASSRRKARSATR